MSDQAQKIPKHIAIIMDGNRRWAKAKGLPDGAGHKQVVDQTLEKLVWHAAKRGVTHLTVWAWSTENWQRDEKEVKQIMKLFAWALETKINKILDQGARLKIIGDTTRFDPKIQKALNQAIERSKDNHKITLTLAINYGGRDEIVRAVSKIQDSRFKIQELDTKSFGQHLDTSHIPDPDLIIRTGGEQRLSGFMLWQSAYAELYFPDTLMPDFTPEELDKAIEEYSSRQRRFGK